MQKTYIPRIEQDNISSLISQLKPHRHIMLWGEMGIGKSTLALQLLDWFSLLQKTCLLLELDPGSPPFGVPGTICIGDSTSKERIGKHMLPLCTFNSGRFRLPLIMAARKLMITAKKSCAEPTLLIDPPGVTRGVGGAEMLTALVESLAIDAILVLCRDTEIPLLDELSALSLPFFPVTASSAARQPTKAEKEKWRTSLWDDFLREANEEVYDRQELNSIGTPPPYTVPDAWQGRQISLLGKEGEPVAMGEVVTLVEDTLTVKVVRSCSAQARTLLVRDAGRNKEGYLATITHLPRPRNHLQCPAGMSGAGQVFYHRSPPLSSHMGAARATLVGGIFGDPLLLVRLRNQKRSFLFDLGYSARLQAKVVHQVDAVFVSHAHLDHIGGFIWFLRCRIGPFGPCRIFGPEGTIQRIEHFLRAITWDRIDGLGPVFVVAEIRTKELIQARLQPGQKRVSLPARTIQDSIILEDGSLNIRAAICDHSIPSIAYSLEFMQEIKIRKDRLRQHNLPPGPWLGRLKQCIAAKTLEAVILLPDGSKRSAGELAKELIIILPGKKLAYVADMADTPENRRKVIDLARGAHTLFCEAAFVKGDHDKAAATQHLTTAATAGIARAAGVLHLVPFHFSKRYELNPHILYEELRCEAGNVRIVGAKV